MCLLEHEIRSENEPLKCCVSTIVSVKHLLLSGGTVIGNSSSLHCSHKQYKYFNITKLRFPTGRSQTSWIKTGMACSYA